MRICTIAAMVALGITLAGCDGPRGPKLALQTASSSGGSAETQARPVAQAVRSTQRYHGRTPEQWGELLQHHDRDAIVRACQALRVLGASGRPYLIQGLESTNPETRRLCLETLTVSDLRTMGDEGKQLLIKLSGDPADLRIRERASVYIAQWHTAPPAP